jgi:SAM-dependent methyltransferase
VRRSPLSDPDILGSRYTDSSLDQSHWYLLPAKSGVLDERTGGARERRLFELGCGIGGVAYHLTRRGCVLAGVDPSAEGTAQARTAYPELRLACGSACDHLATQYGQFPVVLTWRWSNVGMRRAILHGVQYPYHRRHGHLLQPPSRATGKTSPWR